VVELDAALDGLALAEATKSGFLAAFTALFKADKGSDGVVPPVEPTPAPVNALLTAGALWPSGWLAYALATATSSCRSS
jgi:hypothetical protein